MDENVKDNSHKGGKSHNILKGVIYTGLAGVAGAGIYFLSKYRHLGGRATYTIAGIALLVSAPSIIDVAKTYVVGKNKLEELRIYTAVKKDSINAVLRLNAPKDTSTQDISGLFNKTLETTKDIEEKYARMISDNSSKIEELMAKKDEQYNATINDLRENTQKLQNTIENLKYSRSSPTELERIVSQNNNTRTGVSASIMPAYYVIDADKSEGEIQVYGIGSDGAKKSLSISSKASFAINGGPEDGNYTLRDKGSRFGELYPGFLEMEDPIGISGAGENNEHLEEIQQGALANKTGIRVPNEIYTKIARLVDEKKTIINVHE